MQRGGHKNLHNQQAGCKSNAIMIYMEIQLEKSGQVTYI